MSCDLLPTDVPGPHYEGDILDVLDAGWDLLIAHPPCTYLTLAGARWLYEDRTKETAVERWQNMVAGATFFRTLLDARIPRIAVENPVMHGWARMIAGRKADQIVQPWMFGHPERKATGLWLKGLPRLEPTEDVEVEMLALPRREQHRLHYLPPTADRWKIRSATFPGIAAAMADQWGQDDLLTLGGAA